MKAHIFLVVNPKFQLQILYSFGDIAKNVRFIDIPENDFLCIFIIASSPRGAYFLLPLESKQEATSGWNFTKCISEVKVNQLKVKNIHVRMGMSTFNQKRNSVDQQWHDLQIVIPRARSTMLPSELRVGGGE